MSAITQTKYEHIALDQAGVAWIAGSNTKVVELIAEVHA